MTFSRPTLSELAARAAGDVDSRLPGAESRLRRSVLNVLARMHSGALHGAYGMLDDNARFLPDVADEPRLLRWARILGVPRKPAVAAAGNVTFAGTDGTEIAAGTVLLRADGARYLVDADVTLSGAAATGGVTAETAGAEGAMEAGQLLRFQSPVAGAAAVATVAAGGITGGIGLEEIEALRQRVLLRLRNPVRGGAAPDYVLWALEVREVTRAWVYENWDGFGTVKVLFMCDGRSDPIPVSGDVTAVASWIAARRPVCADVTVAAPTAAPLDFDITLTPDTTEVRAAVEAALRDLIAREAEPGGTLLISHIREAISGAAGETDHVLTTPSANVTASAGYITTLGSMTW